LISLLSIFVGIGELIHALFALRLPIRKEESAAPACIVPHDQVIVS
jgi:hypothetical protein